MSYSRLVTVSTKKTPLRFELPQNPDEDETYPARRYARAGNAKTGAECTNGTSGSRDIALVWLKEPVPVDLAEPQKMFRGGLDAHHLPVSGVSGPIVLVGFGNTILPDTPRCDFPPWGSPTNKRSWAALDSRVRFERDSKDGFWERHCHEYRAEFDWDANPRIAQGDSGGPMFARQGDRSVIMGVLSTWDCIDEQMAYSTTSSNRAWLDAQLGGDQNLDGDGIPDDIDNCPQSFCDEHALPPDACNNKDQNDFDEDGIGEKCDNCPQSRCDVGAAGIECFNPEQGDSDKDRDGDVCDFCPDDFGFTLDSDGDGVGDKCDPCEDESNGFPACVTDADCETGGGHCIGTERRRCTQLSDDDRDGLPNTCDICPSVKNFLGEPNSNRFAEDREYAVPLPDSCDEVPFVRVTQTRSILTGPLENMRVPLILRAGTGAETLSLPPRGNARIGFCSCFDPADGRELEEEECAAAGRNGIPNAAAPCSADNLPDNTFVWKGMTMTDSAGFPTFPNRTSRTLEFPNISESPGQKFYWDWRSDMTADSSIGTGDCSDNTCRVHGIFMVGPMGLAEFSPRDMERDLRDTHKLIVAPFLKAGNFTDFERIAPCPSADCTFWYRPGAAVSRPPDWLGQPGIMRLDVDGTPGLLTENGVFEGDAEVPAALRDLISAGDRVWVAAAESPRQIATRGGLQGLEGVVVPRNIDQDFRGTAVLRSEGETRLLGFASPEELERSTVQSGALNDPSPSARSNPGYVLSSTLGTLFTVGGAAPEDPYFEVRGGNIWGYDLQRRRWRSLQSDFIVPTRLLSTSFDAGRQQLLVLSVDDNDIIFGLPRAQLHTVSVQTGEARMVAAWPYLGLLKHHAVASLDDGSVVIATSGYFKTHVWRFSLRESGFMHLEGSATLKGTLLDEPLALDGGLLFPLRRHGKDIVKKVTLADYDSGLPCTGL